MIWESISFLFLNSLHSKKTLPILAIFYKLQRKFWFWHHFSNFEKKCQVWVIFLPNFENYAKKVKFGKSFQIWHFIFLSKKSKLNWKSILIYKKMKCLQKWVTQVKFEFRNVFRPFPQSLFLRPDFSQNPLLTLAKPPNKAPRLQNLLNFARLSNGC